MKRELWGCVLACAAIVTAAPAQIVVWGDGGCRSTEVSHPWQGSWPEVNPATLARQTSVPIVGWAHEGEMPIAFSLEHNSMATRHNAALGNGKWLHSYDIRLVLSDGNTHATIEWAHLKQELDLIGGVWTSADGYRDTLVPTVSSSFLLTTHGQVRYMFQATSDPLIHRLKTIKDPSNNTTTLLYDAQGRLTQVKDRNARNVRLSYNATTGRVTQFKFAAGAYTRVWKPTFNASGFLSKVTWPTVTTETGPATYTMIVATNPGTGNIEALTDRAGNTWQFGYVGDGAAWLQAPGNSGSERVVYADTAQGSAITDPTGVTLKYEYDGLGRLVRWIDDSGNMTSLSHTDQEYTWAPSAVQRPTGESWVYDYDVRGNPRKITPAGLGTFDLTFNTKNRLTKVLNPRVKDANGVLQPFRHRTDYVYDSMSRLVTVKRYTTSTAFIERTFTYTPQGLLATATNELNQVTDYAYDVYGNLTAVSTPGGRVFTWDFPDELTTAGFRLPAGASVAGGPSASYVYDELGRLRERVQADSSGAEYHYDGLDRLVKMEDATGASLWMYSPQGYCDMTSDGGGWTAVYDRDAAGRVLMLTEMGSFGQAVVTCAYDPRGLLASKTDGGTTVYSYDATGRLVHTDRANGTTIDRLYQNGLLGRVEHRDAGQLVLMSWDLLYQVDGRPMRKSELNLHQTEYFYDALDRLILEDRFGPTDDLTIGYTYDNADRRIARDTDGVVTEFTHDADGLVQTLNDPILGFWQYGWDPAGRLLLIQKPGEQVLLDWDDAHRLEMVDGGQTGSEIYAYDALDRRVLRAASDAMGLALFTSAYHFTGSRLRREERDDGMTPAQFTMSWGPGGLDSYFDVFADSSTHERWPITDGTGARACTDSAGAVVDFNAVYDAFGRRTLHSGEEPTYQWGTDAGTRTEGAGGFVDLGGGAWYEPEAGIILCNPPGYGRAANAGLASIHSTRNSGSASSSGSAITGPDTGIQDPPVLGPMCPGGGHYPRDPAPLPFRFLGDGLFGPLYDDPPLLGPEWPPLGPLPGDYDSDGQVDAQDYLYWRADQRPTPPDFVPSCGPGPRPTPPNFDPQW